MKIILEITFPKLALSPISSVSFDPLIGLPNSSNGIINDSFLIFWLEICVAIFISDSTSKQ